MSKRSLFVDHKQRARLTRLRVFTAFFGPNNLHPSRLRRLFHQKIKLVSSLAMSSSDASSSGSTPPLVKRDTKGKSRKTSKGKQPTAVVTPHGKNEGVNPDWAYKPPEGAKMLDIDEEDTADFDWDALQDSKDLELWVVRVPEGVRITFHPVHSTLTAQGV